MNIRQQRYLRSDILREAYRREREYKASAKILAVCVFMMVAFVAAQALGVML